MRILLVVAYDGSGYHGWQFQPGIGTIEGELNKAISRLTGENITVIGASRTDAGVHAMGNIAVFDTKATIPAENYTAALNGILTADIRIMKSFRVKDEFHPRRTNTQKTYCYNIFHGDICPPQKRLYNHHVYGKLDTEAMNRAAGYFIGEHDFGGFCAAGSQAETTVRTIYDMSVTSSEEEYGEHIEIRVTGSGFLYNMVRIIAGTLLWVGQGRIDEKEIPGIISSCDRAKSGPTLPPQGLVLEKYRFL